MNLFISDIFDKIANVAGKLMRYNKEGTLTSCVNLPAGKAGST